MTLFVNNLPQQVAQADILDLFGDYGSIKHIFYPTNWSTGEGLGFAFIQMTAKPQEEIAQFQLHGAEWMGSALQIREVSSD
jgi:RNA recognition motif-containing protein